MLRVVSSMALIALAIRLWSGAGSAGAPTSARFVDLDSTLVSWSVSRPAQVTVEADTIPPRAQRDWLIALRRTGTDVRWSSPDSIGGALVVESGPQPGGPSRVVALAAPSSIVRLGDALGLIDSTAASANGVVTWRATPIGLATAALGRATASAAPRDSLPVRPVLVVGQAGWESRFVVTALEESGWTVAARLTVAPGAVVRHGAPVRIDTASLSAVVVLDSTSALNGDEIGGFVRQGGGLVASGAGTKHPALRGILPAVRAGSPGEIGALLGPSPHSGLSTRTFVANARSVALETRGESPVIVGRRAGAGRVVAIGYDDTWRVRMVPASDAAPEMHRAWWSSLVAGVALARPVARDAGEIDEAPFASTVASLGSPQVANDRIPQRTRWPWEFILVTLAGASMLAEWLSRRLRGLA
jgi:hypothetical protein